MEMMEIHSSGSAVWLAREVVPSKSMDNFLVPVITRGSEAMVISSNTWDLQPSIGDTAG